MKAALATLALRKRNETTTKRIASADNALLRLPLSPRKVVPRVLLLKKRKEKKNQN
jgi:TfoX/Sxy family transcriptional regulator of competence genes